jgi:hypothetical protein
MDRRGFFGALAAFGASQLPKIGVAVQKPPADKWFGVPSYSGVTARMILAGQPVADPLEVKAARRFYAGEQWHREIELQRMKDARPCLVINKLPAIVLQVSVNTRKSERRELSASEMDQVIAVVVRQNRDAQIIYNIARSAEAEVRANIAANWGD